MSQGTQDWLPSQQPGVTLNYAATDTHSIQVWAQDSTDVPWGQPASPEDIFLPPYNTIPDQYSFTSHSIASMHPLIPDVTYPGMIEEQDDMGLDLSQELANIKLAGVTNHFPFDWNLDSHGSHDNTNQSRPSASWPSVIELPNVEPHLKAIGLSLIQHASGKRRKKDDIHICPFRNNRNAKNCNAIFTARDNLRYHVYAHLGYKPYKCGKCKYAASSPATTKRHRLTCKGTSNSTEGNA